MQSFLQYRRFGKRIEAQLERNGEKVAAFRLQRHQAPEQTQLSREPSSSSLDDVEVAHGQQEETLEPQPTVAVPVRTTPSTASLSTNPLPQSCHPSSAVNLDEKDIERTNIPEVMAACPQTVTTHSTTGTTLGLVLTGIEVRDRTTNEGGPAMDKVFVVSYDGDDDPMDPHNWSFARRTGATFVLFFIGIVVGWASAIDSAVIPQAAQAFGVGEVTESLATGTFSPTSRL
jgi:hypothetical protein